MTRLKAPYRLHLSYLSVAKSSVYSHLLLSRPLDIDLDGGQLPGDIHCVAPEPLQGPGSLLQLTAVDQV